MKSHRCLTAPLVPASLSPPGLWVPGDARAELGWGADWGVASLRCVCESGQAPTCDCPGGRRSQKRLQDCRREGVAKSGASVSPLPRRLHAYNSPLASQSCLERKGSGRPRTDAQFVPNLQEVIHWC